MTVRASARNFGRTTGGDESATAPVGERTVATRERGSDRADAGAGTEAGAGAAAGVAAGAEGATSRGEAAGGGGAGTRDGGAVVCGGRNAIGSR